YADMEHFYVGGHSLGGVSASMALGSHPDAFDGLLLLGSYSSTDLSSSGKRVVSVYGSLDGVLDREEYEKCRSNLPPDYQELVIDGGNHSYFGWYGHQDGDNPATITREEQIALTATFVSASL
ncbi:MAG: alpha/beta hydrolase, partial [Bacteroidales bacterium]|nr:alpha/beta hydrolase [Bacteroidales bacterium]